MELIYVFYLAFCTQKSPVSRELENTCSSGALSLQLSGFALGLAICNVSEEFA